MARTQNRAAAARFAVIVTRDVTESTVIEVEAETREQAEITALDKLQDSTGTEWRVDDGSWNNSDLYVTATDPIDGPRPAANPR